VPIRPGSRAAHRQAQDHACSGVLACSAVPRAPESLIDILMTSLSEAVQEHSSAALLTTAVTPVIVLRYKHLAFSAHFRELLQGLVKTPRRALLRRLVIALAATSANDQ